MRYLRTRGERALHEHAPRESDPFEAVSREKNPANVLSALRMPILALGMAFTLATPGLASGQTALPIAVAATTDAETTRIDARAFPRQFTRNGTQFNVHQPQYESWSGNQLSGRFAMSVKTGIHSGPDGKSEDTLTYGVVQFQARTHIDKAARAVVLSHIKLGPASFPADPDKQDEYLSLARDQLHDAATLTVSLDRLESALAIAAIDTGAVSQPVDNTPPRILFSTTPAVLVLVDGQPSLQPGGASGVQRVINTRSLLLMRGNTYYLYLAGHWASAPTLDGPWTAATRVDASLTRAMQQAKDSKQVDTLDDPPQALAQAFAGGGLPGIHVSTGPAELISTDGEPQFAAIPGTGLSYIANTGADVFIEGGENGAWYVLLSGRWFTAPGSKGPWTHVDASALPADFARTPPDSPKSGALASIPGTPEAQEALIANSIPQTATVDRSQASLTVPYDGAPQFKPIAGTGLQYAWNTPVPVILVTPGHYYAVDKGIWFTAASAQGPWAVASEVPAEIYRIPSSSPLHYVTYVRVYGSEGDTVHVGYTPGYYGTVVSGNVVVYGTGYACDPWLGSYWYGCPPTYGMGVYFGWNPWTGWSFGFGWGWGWAGWYGPYSPWWGPWYGPAYPWGWWGGGAAAWNVYGHWGNAAVQGRVAAWANPWTGNIGRAGRGGFYNEATGARGVGRAGINTNVYTGTTVGAAQGIRYNPETGRVVAGGAVGAGNVYTGRAGAAGGHTVLNTDTGQVTRTAGSVRSGPEGAAGVGGFQSRGASGDASGIGGFHYNADSGELQRGGAVRVDDDIYAGRNGNVYHYNDGEWQQIDRSGQRAANATGSTASSSLDLDRAARERGNQRIQGGFPAQQMQRPAGAYQRPAGGSYQRPVGGFRQGLGGGMRGGGFRGR